MINVNNEKWTLEAKKWASRIFCWMEMHVVNTNFNMQRSKIWHIIDKWPKMATNIFWFCLVKIENLSNFADWIKNHIFYMVFYSWWSKSHIKNKEQLDLEEARKLNAGMAMTTKVGLNMTVHVGMNMTRNVGMNVTTNVRPMTPNGQPIFSNVPFFPEVMKFQNFWIPHRFLSNVPFS